jgi:hypothetical protein
MPYHYGWCSNRFFQINYGFHIPTNPMDAIVIKMRDGQSGKEKHVLLHRNGKQTKFVALCTSILEATTGSHLSRQAILAYALGLI